MDVNKICIVETEIQKFYNGKNIFITGGTGYLGKVLVETLLRSCPNVGLIYVLIRSKKDKTIHTRLEELLSCENFHPESLPTDWKSRVRAVEGQLGESLLSISREDVQILVENVNVVFHCAATIKFNEPLKVALKMNVGGTNEVLKLSKMMKGLKSFQYCSTAFSNIHKSYIKEIVYPGSLDPDLALKLIDFQDDATMNAIEPRIVGDWPNTYTFTKAIAENLVKMHASDLPVSIFRPASVVGATKDYPFPGFIDNVSGPVGVSAGVLGGILRVIYADKAAPSNMVPVDYCINAMLASAWDVSKIKYEEPPVFNFAQTDNNIFTIDDLTSKGVDFYHEGYLSKSCIWWPFVIVCNYYYLYMVLRWLLHNLPAMIVDGCLKLAGKEPQLLKVYKKVHKFMDVLKNFLTRHWSWESKNTEALFKRMSPEDQILFNFDMTTLDWNSCLQQIISGITVYLFKDSLTVTPKTKRRMLLLRVAHYTVVACLISLLVYLGLYLFGSFTSVYTRVLETVHWLNDYPIHGDN